MTVTIGVPFSRESRRDLEHSVRSVFAQSYSDWELVLVADGASPELVEHVRRIDDPRVRLVADGRSEGLASRLNQVANLTTTELLFRMDGDDVMHPDRVATQVRALEEDAAFSVIGSRAYVIDETGSLRGGFVNKPFPKTAREHMSGTAFIHPTVAGRTEWFLRHPYDPAMKRAQDRALWLSASSSSAFGRVESPLLFYRIGTKLTYSRYALSSHYDRRAIRTYGPGLVGYPQTAARLLLSILKQARYRASSIDTDQLYSRLLAPLSTSAWSDAENALAKSQASAVPGWDNGHVA